MDEGTEKQIKVLIADDDEIIADILKDIISDTDRSVDVCHDGLSAVERIEKEAFDLIIVDLIMPGMGGLDVLKFAKKINPEIIVIIVTGYASLETALSAIKEGAYDYIRKPCKLEEMKIVVDRATDKIKLNRENTGLLRQLQNMYQEMMVTEVGNKDEQEECHKGSLNFFSSNQAGLHHLFHRQPESENYIDKLHTLSSLRENGMLTENEYIEFKKRLLHMMDGKGSLSSAVYE